MYLPLLYVLVFDQHLYFQEECLPHQIVLLTESLIQFFYNIQNKYQNHTYLKSYYQTYPTEVEIQYCLEPILTEEIRQRHPQFERDCYISTDYVPLQDIKLSEEDKTTMPESISNDLKEVIRNIYNDKTLQEYEKPESVEESDAEPSLKLHDQLTYHNILNIIKEKTNASLTLWEEQPKNPGDTNRFGGDIQTFSTFMVNYIKEQYSLHNKNYSFFYTLR